MAELENMSEQAVLDQIINPAGGINRFRLVECPGFKLVQYADDDGDFLDLIIEDDDLFLSTITFLEKSGVPIIIRGMS